MTQDSRSGTLVGANARLWVRDYRMRNMSGGLGSSMFSSGHLESQVHLRHIEIELVTWIWSSGQSAKHDAWHGGSVNEYLLDEMTDTWRWE